MLTLYDWIYGISQLTAVFLSVIAGLIAISLFKESHEHAVLGAWKYLIAMVVVFAGIEVLGALASFGIYRSPFLTHVGASFVLLFLIAGLLKQININKGWFE